MYGVELVLSTRNREEEIETEPSLPDTSKKSGGTKDPSQLPEDKTKTTLLGVIEGSYQSISHNYH